MFKESHYGSAPYQTKHNLVSATHTHLSLTFVAVINFRTCKLSNDTSLNLRSSCHFISSGACFSKVPIINGPVKLLLFTCKVEVSVSFASNMIKLSVNETEWSSLLARTRANILYISIWKFDFGPETLPGLSRNGPLFPKWKIVRLHLPLNIYNTRRVQNLACTYVSLQAVCPDTRCKHHSETICPCVYCSRQKT